MFGKMHTDLLTVVTIKDWCGGSLYLYNMFCLVRRLPSPPPPMSKSYVCKNNKTIFILFKVKVVIFLLLVRLGNLVIRNSTFKNVFIDF